MSDQAQTESTKGASEAVSIGKEKVQRASFGLYAEVDIWAKTRTNSDAYTVLTVEHLSPYTQVLPFRPFSFTRIY